MPLLHNGTQRKHKDFSSDVASSVVLMRHQMKRVKHVVSPRKSRQQTGRKALMCTRALVLSGALLKSMWNYNSRQTMTFECPNSTSNSLLGSFGKGSFLNQIFKKRLLQKSEGNLSEQISE